jgi:hypothetical protein
MERVESYADENRETKRYYRIWWQLMLEVLLNWKEDDAKQHAWHMIDREGDNAFLTHEEAAWYLLPLITESVREETRKRGALTVELTRAIHDGAPETSNPDLIRRWLIEIRPRVNAVLERWREESGS